MVTDLNDDLELRIQDPPANQDSNTYYSSSTFFFEYFLSEKLFDEAKHRHLESGNVEA